MHTASVILLTFVASVHGQVGRQVGQPVDRQLLAHTLAAKNINTQSSADKLFDELSNKLVDKLLDTLLGRGFRASPLARTGSSAIEPQRLPHVGMTSFRRDNVHGTMAHNVEEPPEPEWRQQESLGRRQALAMSAILGLGLTKYERPASAAAPQTPTAEVCGIASNPGMQFDKMMGAASTPEKLCQIAVYKFEYPETWTKPEVGEIDRTIRGIDSRVFNPNSFKKFEQAYVIVQYKSGPLGELTPNYDLKDPKATLYGFSGGDPDLKQALDESFDDEEVETTTRESNGQTYYEYRVKTTGNNYLVCATAFKGRVFGLFVQARKPELQRDRKILENMISTFRLTGEEGTR